MLSPGLRSISLFPGSAVPLLGEAVLFAAGFAQSFCMVPMAVILLRTADPAFRGRVMGVRMLAVYGLPLGLLLSGPLVENLGFAVTGSLYSLVGIGIHGCYRSALADASLASRRTRQRADLMLYSPQQGSVLHVQHEFRCRRRRRRPGRPLRHPSPAQARPEGARLRGRQRRRRHLVLEPLSRCRCDVESMEYSYSFSDELQQEWKWPERYGTQPEILRYINHVADRFDLRRDIQLNTRIRSAVFDSKASRWTVKTDKGEVVRAPLLHHGGGQSLDAARARLQGPGELQGQVVPHRPVAA